MREQKWLFLTFLLFLYLLLFNTLQYRVLEQNSLDYFQICSRCFVFFKQSSLCPSKKVLYLQLNIDLLKFLHFMLPF